MTVPDRQFRLSSGRRIAELFDRADRAADGRVLVLGEPNGLPQVRLAVAVGGRHGKAVQRNRLKRQCREAFRRVRHELPAGWDLVIVPRPRAGHTVDSLAASLVSLAQRLDARVPGRGKPDVPAD